MNYRHSVFILMILVSALPLACQKTYNWGPQVPVTATPTSGSNPANPTATFTFTPTNTPTGYSCNDSAAGVTVTRAINPSKSFVPLCNGVVLYGDRQNAQIVEYNVITNTVVQTFGLTGTPGDLAMDFSSGNLFCTLDGASKIERVNLNTGVVTGITTTDIGDHLTAANGLVFVCQGVWASQTLTIINGNTATVLNTVSIPYVGYPYYVSSTNTLYFGVDGFSPSYLYSYAYNSGTNTLTQNAVNMSAGSNGEDLVVSPDDNHLAFSTGSGNTTPPYTIVDYPPSNISGSSGSWNTGAYPETAGFSPDSQHLVSTNGNNVFVFSTSNYTTSKTWTNVETGVPSVFRARFSYGGDFVLMLMGDKTSTTAPASIFCSNFP